MVEILTHLFDVSGFPPRWECGDWSSELGWLHILSDLGIWSAYVAIPCVLGFFLLRKKNIPFRMVFWLFGLFILACGTTHLMEAIIFWWPAYRLAGVLKFFTAVVSWCTVIALVPITPQALAMRSPLELEREIGERKRAEEQLRATNLQLVEAERLTEAMNEELERRVEERTAELSAAHESLRAEVTERARAQESLREQGERFRVTLSSIGDAVIVTDIEACVTFMNPIAEELTGWAESEARGKPLATVFRIFNEATREPADSPVSKILEEGIITGFVNHTYLVARDGRELPIDDSGAPIRGDGGEVEGAVLVFRDIGDRRRAEKALQDSEVHFRTMADSIPQLSWMARPDGHIFWYNRRFYEYTGKTFEEMEGWGWQSIHDPDRLPEILEHWTASLRSGEPFDRVIPLRGADGRFRPFLTRVMPSRDVDGRIVLWFGTNTDITERIQMEETLKQADRLKDEFLAMLAHELRNPLAPIRNSLQVMKAAKEHPEILDQYRELAERQVQHMARLLDDLMDVSRISRGRIELRRDVVNLIPLIGRTVEAVMPQIQERQVRLAVSLPPGALSIVGDPTRLEQIISNLLNNAAKYTEPGGSVDVELRQQGHEVVLRIRDNGVGIPPEMLTRIFDLFVQVERRVQRSQGGVGIGLTLVRKLVELHGGTVEAFSRGIGQGSEFVVRLPARTGQSDRWDTSAKEPERLNHSASRHRVLVVDDNVNAAVSLGMLLKLAGQEVRVAYDGPTAIRHATEFRPELVLLDIGMPGMDGYEVCRRLRQEIALDKATVVALTGWGQDDDRRRSHEAGFDHHIVKPVEPSALQRLLDELPVESAGQAPTVDGGATSKGTS